MNHDLLLIKLDDNPGSLTPDEIEYIIDALVFYKEMN